MQFFFTKLADCLLNFLSPLFAFFYKLLSAPCFLLTNYTPKLSVVLLKEVRWIEARTRTEGCGGLWMCDGDACVSQECGRAAGQNNWDA
jgi:hypothetical protein